MILEIKSAIPILRAKEVFSLNVKTRITVNTVAEILKVTLFTKLLARVDLSVLMIIPPASG